MLKRLTLTRTERRVLNAVVEDAGTKDFRNARKLNLGVELWYLAQASLVKRGFGNWTEEPDFDDARAGWRSDVVTPGLISATALGREALKANTFPKRVYRRMAKEVPRVVWLIVTAVSGVVTGAGATLLAQWLSRT